MQFTGQDLLTFLIGFAAAIGVEVAAALAEFDAEEFLADPETFGLALLTGVVTAAGRYLATRLPEFLAK